MKWAPFIVLTALIALWWLQCLLNASARRDEQYKALLREKVEETLRKKVAS